MSSRDRIIEAAMDVFLRYGYRLTSMELVGQEAGLTRQALYHHFDSKEALFRAVVTAVKEGAQEAAAAAAAEQERSGGGLAGTLSAQVIAPLRYFSDCAKGSPHAEELLSEQQRQSRDLHKVYAERKLRMFVETIERFGARGLKLRDGTTPADLARCIKLVTGGFETRLADDATLADLDCAIRLLVAGASDEPASETTAVDGSALP